MKRRSHNNIDWHFFLTFFTYAIHLLAHLNSLITQMNPALIKQHTHVRVRVVQN